MKQPETARPPLPQLWFRMSIVTGNIVQLMGLVIGAILLYLAAHLSVATAVRVILMLGGGLSSTSVAMRLPTGLLAG